MAKKAMSAPDATLVQHDLHDEYVKCLFCSTQYRMFGFTRNNERPTMTNPIAWAPAGMGWKLAKCYQHKLIREHLAKVHRRHVDGWGDQDMKAFYWRTCKAFEAVHRKATPESRRAYNVNGQLSRKLRDNSVQRELRALDAQRGKEAAKKKIDFNVPSVKNQAVSGRNESVLSSELQLL